jgi:L-ascorbate metabolism protein UlaG (beta-lactamase superfamily)
MELDRPLQLSNKLRRPDHRLDMLIHFIRNATLIIEAGNHHILVDPMLGTPGSLPPYAFFRHLPRRNPTVSLPPGTETLLNTVTIGLITHCRRGHFDHLDRSGFQYLAQRKIPVYCNHLDENYIQKHGVATIPLQANQQSDFLAGSIIPFETAHGYGFVGKLMGRDWAMQLNYQMNPACISAAIRF